MFDDDELQQIQEDRDDWKGHVDRQTVKRSRTSKTVLFGSMTASFVMVGFLVFLVASGMMAGALIGLTGIGGFYAEISELEGSDLAIYPALGPTAACETSDNVGFNEGHPGEEFTALPQLRAEIGGAEIPQGQELRVIKDIDMPDVADATGLETFRLELSQGDSGGAVDIDDIAFYVTGLEAEEITFENAQIREFFSENPEDSFFDGEGTDSTTTPVTEDIAEPGEFAIQNRPGTDAEATILNAEARAHFLAFDSLTVENIELETQYGTEDNPLTDPDPVEAADECPAFD